MLEDMKHEGHIRRIAQCEVRVARDPVDDELLTEGFLECDSLNNSGRTADGCIETSCPTVKVDH